MVNAVTKHRNKDKYTISITSGNEEDFAETIKYNWKRTEKICVEILNATYVTIHESSYWSIL